MSLLLLFQQPSSGGQVYTESITLLSTMTSSESNTTTISDSVNMFLNSGVAASGGLYLVDGIVISTVNDISAVYVYELGESIVLLAESSYNNTSSNNAQDSLALNAVSGIVLIVGVNIEDVISLTANAGDNRACGLTINDVVDLVVGAGGVIEKPEEFVFVDKNIYKRISGKIYIKV